MQHDNNDGGDHFYYGPNYDDNCGINHFLYRDEFYNLIYRPGDDNDCTQHNDDPARFNYQHAWGGGVGRWLHLRFDLGQLRRRDRSD